MATRTKDIEIVQPDLNDLDLNTPVGALRDRPELWADEEGLGLSVLSTQEMKELAAREESFVIVGFKFEQSSYDAGQDFAVALVEFTNGKRAILTDGSVVGGINEQLHTLRDARLKAGRDPYAPRGVRRLRHRPYTHEVYGVVDAFNFVF